METLQTATRAEWREWLAKNFDTQKEIWLVFPNKASGLPRIAYNDAVEEALCFGWIDSTVRKLNDRATVQRFTPRKSGSAYSQSNKERLRLLSRQDVIHPSVQATVSKVLAEKFVFPTDILQAIKNDAIAWRHFKRFSDSYNRIRVAYVDGARRRPQEFAKRLANLVKKMHENKQIGYGGIEKYY
jgi:uncharacterized protein YdeI (YjbR/CyaY-like superfamily)